MSELLPIIRRVRRPLVEAKAESGKRKAETDGMTNVPGATVAAPPANVPTAGTAVLPKKSRERAPKN